MGVGTVGVSAAVGLAGLPDEIRKLTTFVKADYADLHTAPIGDASDWSAERWIRAALEDAIFSRLVARPAWRLLGLRLGPRGAADHVQGWRIAERHRDWIRLETASPLMSAEAVCRIAVGRASIGLFLRYEHPAASLLWPPVAVAHRRAVPLMLRQAVELAR